MAITIRFTGETSKMSWAALPVEPACMGKAVGEAGRPLMLCGARLYIITYDYIGLWFDCWFRTNLLSL